MVELRLQERVLAAVMDFPPAELSSLADGSLVAKLTRDAYAVGGFVSGLYPRLLTAVVTMAAAGIALHSRSPVLSIAFMAFIPLAILLFVPFTRRFAANAHSVRKKSDGAFAALFDFFRSLPFLRTLDAERRFAEAPRQSLQELKDGNCAMDRLTVAFGALLGATLVMGEIAVLGVAGALAARGAIPVGDVVVYQMLFLAAMQSVQGIVSLLPETAALREGVDSLDEILGRAPPRRGGRRIDAVESVEFRGVTFAYPGADAKPVVKDFSASFRAGRIVAIVGANGSGKTTLLRLATAALAPQVMPRSLKLPVGFSPSCLNQRSESPAHFPADPAGAIAFHGTADPWAKTEEITRICEEKGIPLYLTEGANHSLECGKAEKDIKTISDVMRTVESFL